MLAPDRPLRDDRNLLTQTSVVDVVIDISRPHSPVPKPRFRCPEAPQGEGKAEADVKASAKRLTYTEDASLMAQYTIPP